MGAGFDALKIKDINLEIEASERKRLLQVDQVYARRPKKFSPANPSNLTVTFTGENGVEIQKNVRYTVPVGAPAGTLNFTVADATYSNALDYQQMTAAAAQISHAARIVSEQPAAQHERLRPGVAHRSSFSGARRRFAGPAAVGGAHPRHERRPLRDCVAASLQDR